MLPPPFIHGRSIRAVVCIRQSGECAQREEVLTRAASAREKVSANGEFRFEDQKVKFQWMRLPYDQEVVISYTVQVAPTISGTFSIGGTFSYIAKLFSLELPMHVRPIHPYSEIDPNMWKITPVLV